MSTSISSLTVEYINQQKLRNQHGRQSVIQCTPINYINKLILAPMVRIGTLPMRLLALQYGADIVYCEEIIDQKLLRSTRIQNDVLGTIDYVLSDGTTVFRTHPNERGKVVFQMGTADAEKAVKVAKMIEDDVAAIDVNMGCPKDYSTKGGMGAALLSDPEKIKQILTALVTNCSKPVTCKIRLLPQLEDSKALIRMIESCGVSAIAIHGRRREERPRHPNHDDQIRELAQTVQIPVIANGGSKDFNRFEDLLSFKDKCSCTSVMVARAAQYNPSIFSKNGLKPLKSVIVDYLRIAAQFNNNSVGNVKYVLQTMMQNEQNDLCGTQLKAANTIKDICSIWSLSDFYDEVIKKQQEQYKMITQIATEPNPKRQKMADGSEFICLPFIYNKNAYKDITPKQVLYDHLRKLNEAPSYNTVQQEDKTFHSVLTVQGVKYSSTYCDKVKRNAEQCAAAVCLQHLGIHDGRVNQQDSLIPQNIPLNIITPQTIQNQGELSSDTTKNPIEGNNTTEQHIKKKNTSSPENSDDKDNELPYELLQRLMNEAPVVATLINALGGPEGLRELCTSPKITSTSTALAACFHRLGGMTGLENLLGGADGLKQLQTALFKHGGLIGLIATAAKIPVTTDNDRRKQPPSKPSSASLDGPLTSSSGCRTIYDCPTFTNLMDIICEQQLRLEKDQENVTESGPSNGSEGKS